MDCAIVETIPFTSAEEFLNALSPFHLFWRNTGSQSLCWAFRGVADAGLSLQAKALRPGELKHYGLGVTTPITPKDQGEQRHYEQEAVMSFASKCIQSGLPIPEDGQWLRNADLQKVGFDNAVEGCELSGQNFPFPLFRSLYALAQHYEVPTRLLDWTLSPYVAAYFACRKVAKQCAASEKKAKASATSAESTTIGKSEEEYVAANYKELRTLRLGPPNGCPRVRVRRYGSTN